MVDAEQLKMMETYPEVVIVSLQMCAADEIVPDAHIDAVSFRQASGLTEKFYSSHPWNRAVRCGSVLSHLQLKSVFVGALLPQRACRYPATLPRKRPQTSDPPPCTPTRLNKRVTSAVARSAVHLFVKDLA